MIAAIESVKLYQVVARGIPQTNQIICYISFVDLSSKAMFTLLLLNLHTKYWFQFTPCYQKTSYVLQLNILQINVLHLNKNKLKIFCSVFNFYLCVFLLLMRVWHLLLVTQYLYIINALTLKKNFFLIMYQKKNLSTPNVLYV